MIHHSNAIRDEEDRPLSERAWANGFPAWLEWAIGILALAVIALAYHRGIPRDPFHSQPAHSNPQETYE